MIKNIFIPQKIGSFYIFTERTVGIEFSKTEILATAVSAHGTRRRIEQLLKEPIAQDTTIDYQDRAAQALKTLMEKVGPYTQLVASLPSESVVFKEISVPSMSAHKIKMIAPFEIESLLPFPLDQATIDAIIVSTNVETQKTNLLVAAAKQDVLQNFLAIFRAAQLNPDRVTTDIFELYGLYHSIPEYQNNQQVTILLHIDATTSQIMLLIKNQIKAVRVIQRGIAHVYHEQGNVIHLESDPIKQSLNKLLDEINFTIDSFLSKLSYTERPEKLVLCGQATEIKGFQEHTTAYLHIPCELLTLNRVLHNGLVTSKHAISNEFAISLAAALSSSITEDVNLNQQIAEEKSSRLIDKQAIVSSILLGIIFIALLTNSILTKRSLQNEINNSESEAINLLTKQLNLVLPKGKRGLEQINTIARNEIERKESIWFALSSGNRFSFLAYLQELSTRIHREELGLDLRQLTINDATDTMTLEGQVKNFEALRTLEEDLSQSKMFKNVSKPQDLKFNISITLEKPYGGTL